jgi:hypothetical protein
MIFAQQQKVQKRAPTTNSFSHYDPLSRVKHDYSSSQEKVLAPFIDASIQLGEKRTSLGDLIQCSPSWVYCDLARIHTPAFRSSQRCKSRYSRLAEMKASKWWRSSQNCFEPVISTPVDATSIHWHMH